MRFEIIAGLIMVICCCGFFCVGYFEGMRQAPRSVKKEALPEQVEYLNELLRKIDRYNGSIDKRK